MPHDAHKFYLVQLLALSFALSLALSLLLSLTCSLEWIFPLPLVATVLIAPKGAESPGSIRMGVIGALVYFFPCEAV